MKDYREISKNVFKKRDLYIAKRKKMTKNLTVATTLFAICVCGCMALFTQKLPNTNQQNITDIQVSPTSQANISNDSSVVLENSVFEVTPIFTAVSHSGTKIGGIVKKTTEEEWKKIFVAPYVSSIQNTDYSFWYRQVSDTTPSAGIINYQSEDFWLSVTVSSTSFLTDIAQTNIPETHYPNCNVIYASYSDNEFYARFYFNQQYYVFESSGLSQEAFTEFIEKNIK